MTEPHRIRAEELWDQARDAYLAGEAAASVCARFGLTLRTFRARAAKHHWRRADQPPSEPLDYLEDADEDVEIDDAELRRMARSRMAAAARRGLATEALRWARFVDAVTRHAETDERLVRDRARQEARDQHRADHDANRTSAELLRNATASARSMEREARALLATDRAATALHDLHDLHPNSPDAETERPEPPVLNRADRRRLRKSGQKRR